MSTDLKNVNDHPIAVLKREMELFTTDAMKDIVGHQQAALTASGISVAIDTLAAYENANLVTFAALDGDALAAVQFLYEGDDELEFRSAVSDLLGLE